MKRTRYSAANFEDGANAALGTSLIDVLRRVVELLYGSCTESTRRQGFQSFRLLEKFFLQTYSDVDVKFDRSIIAKYHAWLMEYDALGISSKVTRFRSACRIIQFCYRNYPKLFPDGLVKFAAAFGESVVNATKPINRELAEKVMAALQSDLAKIEERLSFGAALLSTGGVNEQQVEIYQMLYGLHVLTVGQPAFYKDISGNRGLIRCVGKLGGIEYLTGLIFPTQKDVFVFYLIILFQLAGNPDSVLWLKTNCLRNHSLRDDRVWVVWEKRRAAREQRANFSNRKELAAPQIIKRLIDYSAQLRRTLRNDDPEKEMLFLASSSHGTKVPGIAQMHVLLGVFLKEHGLPKFTFSQLRKTSAVLHHQEGQSILAAKTKLNHASVATTYRYTTLEDRREIHDRNIAAAQEQLIADATRHPVQVGSDRRETGTAVPADTVFGFKCLDPTGPNAEPVTPGGPCVTFFRCATCPGALIPLDQPKVVAALCDARDALSAERVRAENEGWQERFEKLYLPTLLILENELLPKVSRGVLDAAAALRPVNAIPPLE